MIINSQHLADILGPGKRSHKISEILYSLGIPCYINSYGTMNMSFQIMRIHEIE